MNIVEWHFYPENNMDDPNYNDIYTRVGMIPGVLNSKFVKQEGYMEITMDKDLCSKEEILELLTSKTTTYLEPINVELNANMNLFIQKLFKR